MEKVNHFERLVIAAYRLPFKFVKTKKGYRAIQNAGGLVSAILALSENLRQTKNEFIDNKIVWVGTGESLPVATSSGTIQHERFDIIPVEIPHRTNELYYGGFCNDLLWPLFHYFPSYAVFETDYFEAYKEANEQFCAVLEKTIQPGDFIWIHDYQLLLLPEMIHQRFPDATIGFFLHIPFPSFELFRLLPRHWRESLIKGMLGADMIGFHTNDYVEHFIKSVKRTTHYECRQNQIYTHRKMVKADAFPIGIDYNKFHTACVAPSVLAEKNKLEVELNEQRLIFSVDRLDYSKGLLARLHGYETFLEDYPEWHKKVTFNFVVVPSRDSIRKYRDMKKEIEATVGRINGRYSSLSWRPIIYQYRSLSFKELVALYNMSNVALITPLRDGMNLVAKEYVACQTSHEGVLILSEMAGAADELSEAMLINPFDRKEIADTIHEALLCQADEKHRRMEKMKHRLMEFDVFHWAYDFFNQTFDIKKMQHTMKARFIDEAVEQAMMDDYQKADKRILLLDYDGTIVPFAKLPELAVLPKRTFKLIEKLSSDPKNEVIIVSGRDRAFLDQQFGTLPVSLIAEHGYFIRKAGAEWKPTVNTNDNWKMQVRPILEDYVNRCKGTFVEEKTGSLVWHYRNAETDIAKIRVHELRDKLEEMIRQKTDFEILSGHKVLEIKCGRYDKGEAVNRFLQQRHYDFLLAAGDDRTDETMFRMILDKAYTIRIGASPSLAKFHITHVAGMIRLLRKMALLSDETKHRRR
ncbi:MAG: bifunctional alpha,alpha-trehalose-phosphate synthase (UDP-forming)/trehalose-phosphatase [Microbacter sp.]